MKIQKIARLFTVNLGLLVLIMLVGATAAFAVKLPNVQIPSSGSRDSASFSVSDTGTLTVRVNLKTAGILGFGGESRFKAVLRKVGVSADLDSKEINVRDAYKQVTLSIPISECSKTGSYFIRLSNSAPVNRANGEAEFPDFTPPTIAPKTGTLARFGVTQGNTIPINIPGSLQPEGNSGGRFRITATWDGICGLDTSGCKLRFQLKRNDTNFGTAVTGYSHNALFGNANPKMTIDVPVSPNQVTGNWSLEIKGDSRGDVSNVITTVKFTPLCGN